MKNSLVFLLLLAGCTVLGQKHDYQWLFGNYNADAATDTLAGGITVDFNYASPQVSRHLRIADMDAANISYSSNEGRLLFYSNGGDVFDARDSVMLNGDSLNYSSFWNEWLTGIPRYSGLRMIQSLLALPTPRDSNTVYICHNVVNYCEFPGGYADYPTDSSFYTIVDLNANSGNGAVTKKNKIISRDTLAGGTFSAVKHGNGEYWWVLHPYWQGNNCIYEFLLTDTGMGLYNIQCLGADRLQDGALGTSCFSPDGNKYFWVNSFDGIRMFDFDRCTGGLSNPSIIPLPFPSFGDSVAIMSGIAVSPNNRYLYVSANIYVLQYDLLASNIGASVDTVAIWDGTYDPYYPFAATFFLAQNGPDGKIYINATNGTESLHVINRPDMPGDSCLFAQHSLHLHTSNPESLPFFPNYRLGAWQGSACDTLSLMTSEARAEKEKILKVYPNPATDIVTIDYGFTDWNRGDVDLEITNAIGQIVYQQHLPKYSGYQRIDVKSFANGMYLATIKRQNQTVSVSKFVKE